MRFLALALCAMVAVASVTNPNQYKFVKYISSHGKSYSDLQEFQLRFERFLAVDAEIEQLNRIQKTSVHGHNFLSDWTEEETAMMIGRELEFKNQDLAQNSSTSAVKRSSRISPNGQGIPNSVNWATVNPPVVNPVQNQGKCNSGYAFAAAAAMESQQAIDFGNLVKLSEQNFVSCTILNGNSGCNGGYFTYAWNYAQTKNVMNATDYPYTSGNTTKTGSCYYDNTKG